MLPVEVADVAFLGAEVSTFNNILTHGLQAAWLARVLTGAIALPPPRQQQTDVEAEMNWKRTWVPSTSARAAIQQLHMPKYHDRLVADMGLPTYRKSNLLSEMLMPYNAHDYSDIFGLPNRTAWMRVKALLVVVAMLLASLVGSTFSWLVAGGACALVYRLPEEAPHLAVATGWATTQARVAVSD